MQKTIDQYQVQWQSLLLGLLPQIKTLSELAVTIVCLLLGRWPTLEELQQLSGLSRTSVVEGRRRARKRGLVEQLLADNLSLDSGPCLLLLDSSGSETESLKGGSSPIGTLRNNNIQECLQGSKILTELVEMGLDERIARQIVAQHEPDYIQRHIAQTRYAQRLGRVKQSLPGYLYRSIRKNWNQPGFSESEVLREAGADLFEVYGKIQGGELDDPKIEESMGYLMWLRMQENKAG